MSIAEALWFRQKMNEKIKNSVKLSGILCSLCLCAESKI